MKLTEAQNTHNPALAEIKRRGYNIEIRLNESLDEIEWWIARKQDLQISGFNPLSLLGLITIAEQYGAKCYQANIPNWYDIILENSKI